MLAHPSRVVKLTLSHRAEGIKARDAYALCWGFGGGASRSTHVIIGDYPSQQAPPVRGRHVG